jgi:nicotinamidase-related amidase
MGDQHEPRRFAAARWWATATPDRYGPGRAAVVVVDVQNDFCHELGALSRTGADTSGGRAVLPRLEGLLRGARSAGVDVVFVGTHQDEATEGQVWLNRLEHAPVPKARGVVCRTGTWGAEWYGVEPEIGDEVVVKYRFSAFAGTDLGVRLRRRGLTSLLFTGVSTNICVESSLRDGLFEDFYVSIVEDACAAFSRELHEVAVREIGRTFGTVVDVDGLLELWDVRTVGAHRRSV